MNVGELSIYGVFFRWGCETRKSNFYYNFKTQLVLLLFVVEEKCNPHINLLKQSQQTQLYGNFPISLSNIKFSLIYDYYWGNNKRRKIFISIKLHLMEMQYRIHS